MGALGSGLASSTTCLVTTLSLYFLTINIEDFDQVRKVRMFGETNTSQIKEQLYLGIPSFILYGGDQFCNILLTILVGSTGFEQQTSFIICLNIIEIVIQIGEGLSIIVCSYVGKLIGAGNVKKGQ